MKIKRALTVGNLLDKKYVLIDKWSKTWSDAFSHPEQTGTWMIWGGSASGKTTFVLSLLKELATHYKTLYNSLEEGVDHTLQEAVNRVGLTAVGHNILIVKDDYDTLMLRLSRHKSPNIVFIDSWDYFGADIEKYMRMKQRFKNKLFIIVLHADGYQPGSRTGRKIMYDASLKIWVEGYRAISKGRYVGKKGYYTIWEEGSVNYWGS